MLSPNRISPLAMGWPQPRHLERPLGAGVNW